jgi:hypothetical protein
MLPDWSIENIRLPMLRRISGGDKLKKRMGRFGKKFGQQTPRWWGWGTPLKKRAATRTNLM